jgi:NAD(P)-dependent dehydrogenase (short-subunit alcohol dehydrogenase family)
MRPAAGQVAVVTGAASGIGLALALEFSGRGLAVVLADVRYDAARAACARLGDVPTLAVETDVRDPGSVQELAERSLDRFGRVDVICNNAGIAVPQVPSWEQSLEDWRWALDVMLLGVVHGIRSFVPHLVARGSGHVLNTASMAGLMPLAGMAPYAAAKHAVVGLTETLAEELAGTGVGATVLCPGYVPTELASSTRENRPRPAGGLEVDGAPGSRPGDAAASTPRGTGETAADVARAAISGIEAGTLHVVPAAGNAQRARDRVARLLADLPG